MTDSMSGGCQCGRIRYTARIENFDAYLCHCRMCQRATGGVSIAFKNVKKAAVDWAHEPDWYASSAIARRPFCATCGTPLGFEYPDSENCDLTVGSFDDPARFVPTSHFGVEALHEAWLDTQTLPKMRVADNPGSVEKWAAAGLEVPE